ncbi:DNA-binding transcriptional regulator, GntR family [Devosia sp. YR412]|uniref:GntR family transcriptional regulator n=1 Tax=Devosia sp. YR412 TaxID=1881030 RepID=UPI0008C79346|nr:GntR family transcriptional regulator [Devosia sp. YR412]SEP79428.1 DNA-binding transcriptional regulator, GntR family [Devosia sp. YR412]
MAEIAEPLNANSLLQGDRPNLTEQVYEQLIDILIRGELQPGDVIVERKMAERLNASRTPVREALGRLEAEGLVYKQPSRGVTVSPFSTEAFVELLNVRQLLEAEAARLAAGRIPQEKMDAIRAALQDLGKQAKPSLSDIWDVDDMLHGAVADAAGNTLLAGMIRDLRRRTHVFNAYRNPISPKFGVEENTSLLDAIASGDQQRAHDAMAEHIESVRVAIIDRLSGSR